MAGQTRVKWCDISLMRGTSFGEAGLSNPLLSLDVGGRMFSPWWKFSTDAMMLALEAQGVIAMRLTSIALRRGTHAENTRMVGARRPPLLRG